MREVIERTAASAAVRWWLRGVGVVYVLMFVAAAILGAPIRAEGPEGALARAAAGDPTARFLVDTWVTFGIYLGAFGLALLVASRQAAEHARSLCIAVIAMELGGIAVDLYKLARGINPIAPVVWLIIHAAIIVTGLAFVGRLVVRDRPDARAGRAR